MEDERKMTTQERIDKTISALVVRIMPDLARMVENAVANAVGKDRELILDYLDNLAEAQVGAAGQALQYQKGRLKEARESRRAKKSQ